MNVTDICVPGGGGVARVIDIVAVTGAGNLLGNLLCAVTGLLDGGLSGLLGRLTTLLNQILAQLGLGL